MPEPFTPRDLDLRDFAYMPLEVVRLRDSDTVVYSTGDEFRAAVLLWCAAWHQVPAASLPDDDRMLATLAGYGRDLASWDQVKVGALRGFVTCSDGRLYHPVIAEKALESDSKRRSQRRRTAAATASRRKEQANRNDERNDARNVVQGKGREGKGLHDDDEQRALASSIAEEIGVLCGHPTPMDWPPGFCGAPHMVEKWLSGGWRPEIIISTIKGVLGRKRDGPPENISYFEKPIAKAHALADAPLPTAKIIEPKTLEVMRDGQRGSRSLQDDSRSVTGAIDKLQAGVKSGVVSFPPRPSLLPRKSEDDLRLLPPGRSAES
jgi:hypothetical protein